MCLDILPVPRTRATEASRVDAPSYAVSGNSTVIISAALTCGAEPVQSQGRWPSSCTVMATVSGTGSSNHPIRVDEYGSLEFARREHGVVLDPVTLAVDAAATRTARADRA